MEKIKNLGELSEFIINLISKEQKFTIDNKGRLDCYDIKNEVPIGWKNTKNLISAHVQKLTDEGTIPFKSGLAKNVTNQILNKTVLNKKPYNELKGRNNESFINNENDEELKYQKVRELIEDKIKESTDKIKERDSHVNNIIGNDEAKNSLIRTLRHRIKYMNDWLEEKDVVDCGKILCGITGLAKTELVFSVLNDIVSNSKGYNEDFVVLLMDGSDFKTGDVGDTQRNTKLVFKAIDDINKENGTQAILFIDECDFLLQSRDTHSVKTKEMGNALFILLGGAGTFKSIYILGTTNLVDQIDPSIFDTGRLGFPIILNMPSKDDIYEIFKLKLNRIGETIKFSKEIDLRFVSDRFLNGYTGRNVAGFARELKSMYKDKKEHNKDVDCVITMKDIMTLFNRDEFKNIRDVNLKRLSLFSKSVSALGITYNGYHNGNGNHDNSDENDINGVIFTCNTCKGTTKKIYSSVEELNKLLNVSYPCSNDTCPGVCENPKATNIKPVDIDELSESIDNS